MDATNETSQRPDELANSAGSKDGATAADHDQPYRFGRRPNARAPYPFTERQYARLLILRSRVQDIESTADRAA
jgi:uncharacterized Fe-S cluster-containing radical SAM superfamily enzyme